MHPSHVIISNSKAIKQNCCFFCSPRLALQPNKTLSFSVSQMVEFARVQKEVVEINRDKGISGVSIDLHGDDLSHLSGTTSGPISTPYEGGTFQIDIRLPVSDRRWFPDTELVGGCLICRRLPVCASKDAVHYQSMAPKYQQSKWSNLPRHLKGSMESALTLKTALLSLQALLSSPEPDDPQDAVVAQQYLQDYPTFVGTARYWTETFAKRTSIGTEEKVQKLVEMGFPEDLVRKTLDMVGGDENSALEKLCSG